MTLSILVGAAVEDSSGKGQTPGHVHLVLDRSVISAPVFDVKISGFCDDGVGMVWNRINEI